MASLIKKKKGNRLYYYLVESARVDGQPRIVHQAYLGTAEKLAELVQQKSAPVPLSATSQAFWDAFEQILPETSATLAPAEDPLDQAQLRLLGLWKEKQLVGRWLLAYDTTNFYTYIASTNTRNQLAQRGHNRQGRHNLRQVGL